MLLQHCLVLVNCLHGAWIVPDHQHRCLFLYLRVTVHLLLDFNLKLLIDLNSTSLVFSFSELLEFSVLVGPVTTL